MADGARSPRRPQLPTTALVVWGARAAWLAVAVIGGAAVAEALEGRSGAVSVTGAVLAWTTWAIGAVALAVASTVSLTTVRAVVPAALVATVACSMAGADAVSVVALAVPATLAATLTGSAELGRAYVQASAYGDEARFPLRPPVGYLLASVATWIVAVPATGAAVLGWAGRAWVVAIVATIVVALAAAVLPRRWHQLSRRWVVLVPAGLVVHDPVVLGESLMLSRAQVAGLRLAPPGTGAADLTGPTPGVAIEVAVVAAVTAVFAPTPAEPRGRVIHMRAFLVAPSRPGAVLRAAAGRRLPTGQAATPPPSTR